MCSIFSTNFVGNNPLSEKKKLITYTPELRVDTCDGLHVQVVVKTGGFK